MGCAPEEEVVFTMESDLTADKLVAHHGHKIVIVTYGDPAVGYSLECESCYEVLADCSVGVVFDASSIEAHPMSAQRRGC
jgi:hypothetical protein